ncbi:MBG domain-containing protein, partial [Paucilactobacillus hokkaidonensis]
MKNLKKLSSKRSLVNLGHVTSTRYKMYKSGRFWVFAGMTSFVLLIGGGTVKADTVASNNSGTTVAVSASSAGADNNRVVLAATNSSGSSKATPAVSNDDSASTTPQTADSDNQSIVHASSGANQESNNATSALTPTNSATSTSVVNQSSVSNQSTAPSTAAAITTRDADVTESSSVGVTDPEISVAEDELWSGLSSMQVNLTLNYSDTVNIPKGTRIVLHFTNPGIIDWSTLAAVTLPKYLTQTIDAATGTVTLVYNNAILDQSGQLGISYIAKVANPAGTNYGKTYMNATLITPDNQTVDFTAPADPITVNDLTSSGASVITTYWPGGENYGATGAATLLNDTNTPQPTGQPSVDSYGNNDDIISVGSFTNNGSTLPAMVDLNLNWTSDWASQLMQLNTSSEMSNYINADGTFNYDSSNSVDSGFFATTIKVNGNLKLTTADIHLYLPDTGEDVTNDYYIEELGDGVFGIMLKTNTAITSVAAEYPRTVIYLTPEVTGALATEPTDGTTDPNATSSIVANVIWYPSDAPTGYYVQNKTTLVPTWSPNAYSTSFVPKISGFGDQTVVSGQSITTATLLRGVTASDVEDGDLTSKLSIVDLGGLDLANPTAGTYQVEVEVTDSDGNVTTATATITVHNLASYNIIEKFQDANGKTIAPDESTTMAEGDFKEFTAPVITGYTFVSVSPSADVIATQDETLIFTYDQNAVVTLSGTDGKVYDGTSGSIDVSKYQVILPDGINYELQSGDLQFSSTNPIVVGTYGVKISAQGLANMQAATTGYNLSVGEDNAEYSITPAPVSAV